MNAYAALTFFIRFIGWRLWKRRWPAPRKLNRTKC